MKPNDLYSPHRPKVDGGFRVTLELYALTNEVFPDSDYQMVLVEGELDWSWVRHDGRTPWVRPCLFGRAFQVRERLAALVHGLYPDVRRAAVAFWRQGVPIGVIELPLPGR
jgi:hypothetical protein